MLKVKLLLTKMFFRCKTCMKLNLFRRFFFFFLNSSYISVMLYDELKYHFFKKNSYMVGILRFLLMPASITD